MFTIGNEKSLSLITFAYEFLYDRIEYSNRTEKFIKIEVENTQRASHNY